MEYCCLSTEALWFFFCWIILLIYTEYYWSRDGVIEYETVWNVAHIISRFNIYVAVPICTTSFLLNFIEIVLGSVNVEYGSLISAERQCLLHVSLNIPTRVSKIKDWRNKVAHSLKIYPHHIVLNFCHEEVEVLGGGIINTYFS